jgi:hypothetical protein
MGMWREGKRGGLNAGDREIPISGNPEADWFAFFSE